MNRMVRYLGIVLLIGYGGICSGITLQKVLHTDTHTSDTGPYVELGTLVLYVDAYPKVDQISLVPGMKGEKRTFLLRDVQVSSPECRDRINELNKSSGNVYTIRLLNVNRPEKGMQLEITYDPKKVEVKRDDYQAVTMQKSIVFHFYNKQFLNSLARNPKPIIAVASRSEPKTIVIDCGHGGSDSGTIGCNRVTEKEISLQVGLAVAQLLTTNGFSVELSRTRDVTVALDERTTFANAQRADAFISIHANAALNKNACGIETHCMASHLFKEGFCTLSSESAAWCNKLFQERCNQGSLLAHSVHAELLAMVRGERHTVIDRHVRHSVPFVLLGVEMPAILVEVGFLSHPQEAQLLADAAYQKKIARGISRGIVSFFHTTEQVL